MAIQAKTILYVFVKKKKKSRQQYTYEILHLKIIATILLFGKISCKLMENALSYVLVGG